MQFLLQGVSEFQIPKGLLASEVLVHGPLTFPIGTTDKGRAFIAGAYYGQGRVIVVTHEGLLGQEVELTLNCLCEFLKPQKSKTHMEQSHIGLA